MGTATILLSFELLKEAFDTEEAHVLYQYIPELCFPGMDTELQTVCECGNKGDKLITASAEDGSHVVIHLYHFGLLTVDIQMVVESQDHVEPTSKPYDMTYIKDLEKKIVSHLKSILQSSKCIYSPIRRGPGIAWSYGCYGDGRIVEYDYVEQICDMDTKMQNIKIYRSKEFGNVLHLDDNVVLGESDSIYFSTLLGQGLNSFKDKSVLVLGGGHGGILHEVLKDNPKHVLMVEEDEEIIKACRAHMRSVCGDCLDQFEGPNYQIKISACEKTLRESVANSVEYDFIINDLAVSVRNEGEEEFSKENSILALSLNCLAQNGKYLSRGNPLSASITTERTERDLKRLPCSFKRREVHIPSYRETFTFYEVWK